MQTFKQKIVSLTVPLVFIFLTGCGAGNTPVQKEKSAAVLFAEAQALEGVGLYKDVIKAYIEVERQHPQSKIAKDAKIRIIDLAYEKQKYMDSIAYSESFLTYNPDHKQASRIFYIRALSYVEQISDIQRDQGSTEKALKVLNDLVFSYPDSKYAVLAETKIDFARNQLAGKELQVGKFYQGRRHYQAAIMRFNTVLKEYSQTTYTPETLARLTEVYLALGQPHQAKRTVAVLGHNHKGSTWYKYAYDLYNANLKQYNGE